MIRQLVWKNSNSYLEFGFKSLNSANNAYNLQKKLLNYKKSENEQKN